MKTDRLPAENLDAAGGRSGRSRYIAETVAVLPTATPRKPAPSLGFRCTHSGKTWWVQVGTRHLHVWAKHQLYPLYPPCTHQIFDEVGTAQSLDT